MKSFKVLMVVAVMMVAGSAFAQTTVTSGANADNVTATVLAGCTITTFDIAFGNYDPSAAAADTASDTADVTCSTGLAYTVALSGSNPRSMAGPGTDTLAYDLTLTAPVGGGTGTGTAQAYTVDGSIPVGQYVQTGAYDDTVTISVTF